MATDQDYILEIVREVAFDLMVQRGLRDSDERRIISNEEMKRRIALWRREVRQDLQD